MSRPAVPSRECERRFLLAALWSSSRYDDRVRVRAGEVSDWSWTGRTAQAYAIGGRVYRSLERSKTLRTVPGSVAQSLRDAYEENVAREARHCTEIEDLATFAARSKTRMLLLKGGGLLARGIGELGTRRTDDLDVLVCPSDLERALRQWLGEGAREIVLCEPDGQHRSCRELRFRNSHAAAVLTTPQGTILDVHGRLPGRPAWTERDFEALWDTGEPVPDLGRNRVACGLRTPTLARTVQDLCFHTIERNGARTHHLVRHLADLDAVLQAEAWANSEEWTRARQDPNTLRSLRWLAQAQDHEAVQMGVTGPMLFSNWSLHDRVRAMGEHWGRATQLGRLLFRDPGAAGRLMVPHPRYLEHCFGAPRAGQSRSRWYLSALGRRARVFPRG